MLPPISAKAQPVTIVIVANEIINSIIEKPAWRLGLRFGHMYGLRFKSLSSSISMSSSESCCAYRCLDSSRLPDRASVRWDLDNAGSPECASDSDCRLVG